MALRCVRDTIPRPQVLDAEKGESQPSASCHLIPDCAHNVTCCLIILSDAFPTMVDFLTASQHEPVVSLFTLKLNCQVFGHNTEK